MSNKTHEAMAKPWWSPLEGSFVRQLAIAYADEHPTGSFPWYKLNEHGRASDTARMQAALDRVLAKSLEGADEKLAEIVMALREFAIAERKRHSGKMNVYEATLADRAADAIALLTAQKIAAARTDITALCQQALRAIELEAKLKEVERKLAGHVMLGHIAAKSLNLTTDELTALEAERDALGAALQHEEEQGAIKRIALIEENSRLQSELTAARNALEEERERCAKACYQVVGKYRALAKDAREKELDLSEDYYAARASAAEDCAEMVLRLPSPQVKP